MDLLKLSITSNLISHREKHKNTTRHRRASELVNMALALACCVYTVYTLPGGPLPVVNGVITTPITRVISYNL